MVLQQQQTLLLLLLLLRQRHQQVFLVGTGHTLTVGVGVGVVAVTSGVEIYQKQYHTSGNSGIEHYYSSPLLPLLSLLTEQQNRCVHSKEETVDPGSIVAAVRAGGVVVAAVVVAVVVVVHAVGFAADLVTDWYPTIAVVATEA